MNASKRGISASIGGHGLTTNISKKGRTRDRWVGREPASATRPSGFGPAGTTKQRKDGAGTFLGVHRGHGDRPLDPGAPCTRHSYGGLIGPATDFNRVGSVEIYFYSS